MIRKLSTIPPSLEIASEKNIVLQNKEESSAATEVYLVVFQNEFVECISGTDFGNKNSYRNLII